MSKYRCKECGTEVIIILGEQPIRYCKCDAPIIVDMESSINIEGNIKS